jgi:uncharacterized protein involved in exopolysaccharide biosynthesis
MTASQGYVAISRRSLDVEDYIDILRRHLQWIIAPLFAGLVISCVVAFLMPNVYVSQAVMRITPAQIPQELVPSVVTQQMTDRVLQMQQDILSRDGLSELITKLNLYKSERDRKPLQDVIDDMKHDIKSNFLVVPTQGKQMSPAFSISFSYPDRNKAHDVVQYLVSRFSDSNITQQKLQTGITQDFLKDELTQAKSELDRLESQLTDFKVKNSGRLPEQLQLNISALNSLQGQLAAATEAVNRNSQEKITLESALQTYQNQYDSLASMTSQSEEVGAAVKNDRLITLNRDISQAESKLAGLKELYTEKYPEIRNMQGQINVWKRERDELQKQEETQSKPQVAVRRVARPEITKALTDLKGSIDAVKAQIRARDVDLKERLRQQEQLTTSIQAYQARVEALPANEQVYSALLREHQMANDKYQLAQKRANIAKTAQEANGRKAGENLEVLDNASMPDSPSAPNRWMIVGIGTGIGLVLGIFLAGFREMKDTSLKNLKDVRAYTNLPVLSSIPLLENALIVRRKRRLAYLAWAAAVIIGVVAMSASLYYHLTQRT